jgi:hypothetical protein
LRVRPRAIVRLVAGVPALKVGAGVGPTGGGAGVRLAKPKQDLV